ncbi:MAG: (Fe-S)-binding protein [Sphingobacteriaceae bacterium]|nr:(Fe-S)-binding protein [Sphingobacteriaceae bacterium]
MIAVLLFIILFLGGFILFGLNMRKIRRNVMLGRSYKVDGPAGERLKTMILVAFGQQKMFSRPIPAILHLFLYVAFVITQIELIEIIVDGVSGSHRFFSSSLGGFYTFVISFIEILSVLAFIGTIAFLFRRNIVKLARFQSPEMKGWPFKDANFILFGEITLICFIFMMNGADSVKSDTGFIISSNIGPALFGGMSDSALHSIERIGWWGHLVMVLAFLNYLPFSKHLHILLGFPNTYYSNLNKKGKFTTLESVTDVVAPNFDPSYVPKTDPNNPIRFGAKDVQDLTWKNLLDAYTCTECGRCTSACPQNQTGKKLSPRKIMMDTRDRVEEVGKNIDKNKGVFVDDGKSLLDLISKEEIWACNTCNACVQECPVNIDPLAIIIELRRYLVMEESQSPNELNTMFSNVENNGAPWQFAQSDRANWINEN